MGWKTKIVYTGDVLDLRAKVWVCVVPLLMGLPVKASAVSVCKFGLTAPEEIVVADDSGGAIGPYDGNALMRTPRVQVIVRIDLEAANVSQTNNLRASRLFQ